MQNYYEKKAVKKYTTQSNNPSFNQTQIALNSRVLLSGSSGSGKSNLLINWIARASDPPTFHKIIVCYKESEPLYKMLGEKLGSQIEFYTSPSQLPRLEDIRVDSDKKPLEPSDNIFVVIDDWVDQASKFPILSDYFLRGRKYCTLCFITQSYYKVPKFFRSQLTYILLLKMSGKKDTRLVLSDNLLGVDIDTLFSMYEKAVKEPFNFFKIDVNCSDENKKYSHNFDGFFKLKNDTN